MKTMFIPPNRANAKITGPLTTINQVHSKLLQLGMTAADLEPIDWRNKKGIPPLSSVKNQENCGDCWAISSTSALTDRFIIQKNLTGLELDPVITTQCVAYPSQGCGGGQPGDAGKYFATYGLPRVSDTCPPFAKYCPDSNVKCPAMLPSCDDMKSVCKNSVIYKALPPPPSPNPDWPSLAVINNGEVDVQGTITHIKAELQNGPVVASFFVPADFCSVAAPIGYNWSDTGSDTSGIYINGAYNDILFELLKKSGSNEFPPGSGNIIDTPEKWGEIITEGDAGAKSPSAHAVEVVGWGRGVAGSYGNVSYWIVRNSWGPEWGEGGFFRIAMNETGKGNNSNLGFDVPVETGNGLFGSMVSFSPDVGTGDPHGAIFSPLSDGSSAKKIYIALGIIGALLGLGVLFYFLRHRENHRRS